MHQVKARAIILMNIPRSISQSRKTSSLLHQVKACYDSYEYSSFYKPTMQNKFAFTPSKNVLIPLQASSSSNSFSTINNFTGTVNFYGAFTGFPGLSNMPVPTHQSTEPRRTWKSIRASVLSDSDED